MNYYELAQQRFTDWLNNDPILWGTTQYSLRDDFYKISNSTSVAEFFAKNAHKPDIIEETVRAILELQADRVVSVINGSLNPNG